MREEDMNKIVLSGFCNDVKKNQREKVSYNRWDYRLELFLITIKSLVPNLEGRGSIVCYERFQKELELWMQYRHGGNGAVLGAVSGMRGDYFDEKDESVLSRSLSLVLANESIEVLQREIVKNTLYFTADPETVLAAYSFGILSSGHFAGMSPEENIAALKEAIIGFSTRDSLIDSPYIKRSIERKATVIAFEKKKIGILKTLDDILGREDYDDYIGIIVNSIDKSTENDIAFEFLKSEGCEIGNLHLENMSRYLWKMRKGRIDIKHLEIDVYVLPDVFEVEVGQRFFHSLLSSGIVLGEELKRGFAIRYVKTKAGVYRFFRKQ